MTLKYSFSWWRVKTTYLEKLSRRCLPNNLSTNNLEWFDKYLCIYYFFRRKMKKTILLITKSVVRTLLKNGIVRWSLYIIRTVWLEITIIDNIHNLLHSFNVWKLATNRSLLQLTYICVFEKSLLPFPRGSNFWGWQFFQGGSIWSFIMYVL